MAHYDLPHQHGQDFKLVLEKVPDDEQFRIVSAAFQQLSDPTRLKIMWLLCHSEECVYNIAAAMGMSNPAVSHHLRLLRNSGLIVSRRDGKEVYYTIAKTNLASLLHKTIDSLFEISCPTEK